MRRRKKQVLNGYFPPILYKKFGNTYSIPEFFYFVFAKTISLKTAPHPEKMYFFLGQGKKRRNTGFVFRAFLTQYRGKRRFSGLLIPTARRPFAVLNFAFHKTALRELF